MKFMLCKITLVLFLLIFAFTSFCQFDVGIKNITNIFLRHNITFYPSQKDTLVFVQKDSVVIDDYLHDAESNELINVDSLEVNNSIETFIGKQFYYKFDSLNILTVSVINKRFSFLTKSWRSRINEDWRTEPSNLIHNKILWINDKSKILLFYNEKGERVGGMIPLRKGQYVIYDNYHLIERKQEIENIKQLFKDEIRNENINQISLVDGKYGVSENFYKQDSLSYHGYVVFPDFDSLKIMGHFMLGFKSYSIELFDVLGENILVENYNRNLVRAAFISGKFAQILIKNVPLWIDTNGKVYPNFKYGIVNGCDAVPTICEGIEIVKNQFQYDFSETGFGKDTVFHSFVNKPPNVSKIKFLNHSNQVCNLNQYAHNAFFRGLNNRIEHYYLVEGNSKFGIIKIEWKKQQKSSFALPMNCEYIQKSESNTSIIFRQNGLFGFFPLNQKGKYNFVEKFNFNFARIELTNGKSGWLGLDGKEYLDN